MTESGVPVRQNTFIDIPDSLRLPHFMLADGTKEEDQDPNGLSQGYKLVLQSVICHRGDSIHSGHYVSYARVAPKLLTDNRRHDLDPPPDYEEPTWVRFDDLAEKRVEAVDDIQQCLRRQEEMPYVLIYQIVPMVDVTTTSTDGSVTDPPCYAESTANAPGTPSVGAVSDAGQISKSNSGFFDSSATTLAHTGPHIRLSSEIERPPRFSFDDERQSLALRTDNNSRRGSITFSEPAIHTNQTASSEAVSPAVTPQEETTGARLSRAAAMFKGGANKSRPTSQAGEGRISLTISRFGFGRQSKDSGSNSVNGTANSEASASEQGVGPVEGGDEPSAGKEKEKEKEHHHLLHHHHNPKKDKEKEKGRDKSKSRDKEEKKDEKKDKGKGKGKAKDLSKEGIPDRECVVM